MHKPITVSIVSHGHLELIRPLLSQLNTYCHQVIEKVVLTINKPEPDALAGEQWRFPVERIENTSQKGFGANQNQAFQRCSTPWFLALNPDIRLDQDVLTPLIAQAGSRTGLLTPLIFEPGKTEPEQQRGLLTPLEILTRRRPQYVRPKHPAWIPGLFMLFRYEAFAKIRGFDERFFMYGEDFDICARTQLAGWQIQVANELSVVHEAQRASHRDYRHMWWHVQSLGKVWSSSSFWRLRRQLRSHPSSDA
ncbi:glycosyltransferase family 2 protein [Variovorax sp. HJSM1_2]|uniref:glycosyltransferase family 2 protein n=1 Tax=Variovorax sp. HJSM1_2 TaxID=3366263 RepID=UPI003BE86067